MISINYYIMLNDERRHWRSHARVICRAARTRLYPEKTFQPRPYDSLHQRRIVAHIIDKAGLFFTVAKEACNGIVRGTR